MSTPTVIDRSIEKGEFFLHRGDCIITGSVCEGADVTVYGGTLYIKGGIENNTRVTLEPAKKLDASALFNLRANPVDGLTVDGTIGDNVVLASFSGIRLRNEAGAALLAFAGGDFRAKSLGNNARVDAKRDIALTGVGAKSQLLSGGRMDITFLGAHSTLKGREIMGADAHKLPYKCPISERDMHLGRRTTYVGNGAGIVRIKRI